MSKTATALEGLTSTDNETVDGDLSPPQRKGTIAFPAEVSQDMPVPVLKSWSVSWLLLW